VFFCIDLYCQVVLKNATSTSSSFPLSVVVHSKFQGDSEVVESVCAFIS
jgi:hypothetical protein